MRRPKLKDSLYGEMYWEDWDEFENYWFAKIDNIPNESFELLINAASQADFLAVRGTHPTYKNLIGNIASIRGQMVRDILEKSRHLFKNERQRKSVGEKITQTLHLFCIKIFQDLSAEMQFTESDLETSEEVFYALIDNEGNLTEAGIRKP